MYALHACNFHSLEFMGLPRMSALKRDTPVKSERLTNNLAARMKVSIIHQKEVATLFS